MVSPDGAYGGPQSVAFNQAKSLHHKGYEVTLVATTRGYTVGHTQIDGVDCHLFHPFTIPGLGFAGLTSPALLRWLSRHAREYDAVHVHTARDLVTLPALRLCQLLGLRTFAQTHGMIDHSSKVLSIPIDRYLTRPALMSSDAVFALTTDEAHDLSTQFPSLAPELLPNGVAVSPLTARLNTNCPEVLFLARLHTRKRPDVFVDAAVRLLDQGLDARFTIIGPDEGMGDRIDAAIRESRHSDKIRREPPIEPAMVSKRMSRAQIYVLPSLNEPFGMTILEALSVGTPVVVTESCGLADFISSHTAGLIARDTADSIASAIERLLSDPDLRSKLGQEGHRAVAEHMSMNAVTGTLERQYFDSPIGGIGKTCLGNRRRGPGD